MTYIATNDMSVAIERLLEEHRQISAESKGAGATGKVALVAVDSYEPLAKNSPAGTEPAPSSQPAAGGLQRQTSAGFFGKIRDIAKSVLDDTKDLIEGSVDTVLDTAKDLHEAGKKILDGDLGGGLSDAWIAFRDGFVDTAINDLGFISRRSLQAIQELLGTEAPGRKLTAAEIEVLRPMFGSSVDYDKVRVKEKKEGLWGDLAKTDAFVVGNTIYFEDPSVMTTDLLAHEMVHIWQFQNGGSFGVEALYKTREGHGYDWQASVPAVPWVDLEPEQQAEFIQDLVRSGYFERSNPANRRFEADTNGDGVPEDLSQYAREAVAALRSGQGAKID